MSIRKLALGLLFFRSVSIVIRAKNVAVALFANSIHLTWVMKQRTIKTHICALTTITSPNSTGMSRCSVRFAIDTSQGTCRAIEKFTFHNDVIFVKMVKLPALREMLLPYMTVTIFSIITLVKVIKSAKCFSPFN